MRSFRFSLALFSVLYLALTVSAYTVNPDTKIIATDADESVNYSELSTYGTDYTINLAAGATLTHTEWVSNPLTGTGTFQLSPTGAYDGPVKDITNLTNFTGTVKLLPTGSYGLRFRGYKYNTFNPEMTIDASGNSQIWTNSNLNCKLYLHDMTNGYDGLGLFRFDGGSNFTVSGPISISGKVGLSVRVDGSTVTETISGAITGVHASGDETKDYVVFNGQSKNNNTHSTLVLKAQNYWNGSTAIRYMAVELAENGTLGEGVITISGPTTSGDVTSDCGSLVLNRSVDFSLPEIQSATDSNGGKIVKKNSNKVTIKSLSKFNGTLDIQSGTVQAPLNADGSTAGGIQLTGTGTYYGTAGSSGENFNMNRFDLSAFQGTFEIQQGRTFQTYAKYFGKDATVKVNSGASFMFYDSGNNMAPCGDYASKFLIAGNGHSENLGAIRFHVTLSDADKAKLNTTSDVSLPNITGAVTLEANAKIIARVSTNPGWGAITGNISGNYALTLSDSNGWILLTGTNSYGETIMNQGTVQLGYKGTINGKAYDGTTGTLGTGKVTLNSGAILDYRRVNEYKLNADVVNGGTIQVNSGTLTLAKSPTGNGTISVAEGATLNSSVALTAGNKFTGAGTINMTSGTTDAGTQLADFSGFSGTLNIYGTNNARYMLNGKTIQFGSGRTVIGNNAQLYLNGTTVYGNLEFGESSAYSSDSGYQAALRSDGGGTSKVYGSVKLTDDKARIVTRAANGGNVEAGSKLILYADVTGPGSLTKIEDSAANAGVLSIGTATVNGKTYGGTVDYAGTTTVKTGVLRLLDGVTMYAQDGITVESGAVFDLQKGAKLSAGAKDATTGTKVNVTGSGEIRLNGDLDLTIFSDTDFDQLIFADTLKITSDSSEKKTMNVNIDDAEAVGDSVVKVVQGINEAALANWSVSVPAGFNYQVQDGTLVVGSSSALPEPSTWVLLALGTVLLAWSRKRK